MDKKILNLGRKSGKMLLFGGVYSNLQALESLIKLAGDQGIAPENCICTGDIIGYCGQPQESLDTFKDWGGHSILGNVEIQLRDDQEDCGCDFTTGSRCDGFSEIWYAFAKANLHTSSKQYFSTLPDHIIFEYAGQKVGIVHGSYNHVSQFIFKSTDWSEKQQNFDSLNVDVIVAGHCGLPFADHYRDQTWLNPGVLGMPANNGSNKTWAMIIDDAQGMNYEHFQLKYDHNTTIVEMQKNRLPAEYAVTLQTGIWDNMEILPDVEKELQGSEIILENPVDNLIQN
ncbi:Calcineurin-like phosphoesterase superfamily domain-containing protein [Nonlabens sp. Hel1_33_55]|uniref:metallophosphoesterase family protein n=1 Tax=Nonlabens sp. Hel1_33_55 TaxID=1336802 RepID=UPI000875CC37|nr:metallophosphoesterase family protein [Nonlabens sp. Hel1_33_55]SCY43038.1 Calcineurin-like phosphoesterase superfamily domain-containing protein [Nonlabens sp. Hel1_33_55]